MGETDPLDDERLADEDQIASAMYGYFGKQFAEVVRQLKANRVELIAAQRLAQEAQATKQVSINLDWGAEEQALLATLGDLLKSVLAKAQSLVKTRLAQAGVSVSWEVFDQAARDYADNYTFGLIKDLTDSTRRQLGQTIAQWIETPDDFDDLVEQVRRILPPDPYPILRDRARLIAQTETTRIYAESRIAGFQAAGLTQMEWRTAEDELVCPICAPMAGMVGGLNGIVNPDNGQLYTPPAHPGCRCWLVESAAELDALSVIPEEEQPAAPDAEEVGFPYRVNDLRLERGAAEVKVGAHTKFVYSDPDGGRWLFKPQDEFRAYGDKVAYDLAKALGHNAAETYVVEINGKLGSIQRLRSAAGSLNSLGFSQLTPDQVIQLQKEHVFDWLIGNHDGHGDNILLEPDGNLLGIDKGQLFKFYDKDKLAWDYNPNRQFGVTSVYNRMLQDYAAGRDVVYHAPDHQEIGSFIQRIESLDNDVFTRIIRPYAERAKDAGFLAFGDVETFLDQAVGRKNSIGQEFQALYQRATTARQNALGKLLSPNILTAINAEFMSEVDQSAWQGKTLLVDGEDIENMSALVYRVDGDGTIVEFKVRADAERKILAKLNEYGGTATIVATPNDPYWNDVLKIAKSYNYHLDQSSSGYDGVIPDHTKKMIVETGKKMVMMNPDLDDPVVVHYKDYILALKSEISGYSPLGSQVGNFISKYEPPKPEPRATPSSRDRRIQVRAGSPAAVGVRNQDGRIIYDPSRNIAFKGYGYDLDWGDGIRANYISHDQSNFYSKQGRMWVQIDGDLTPDKLDRMLSNLGEIGLDGRLGTRQDMEFLYLAKCSYASWGATPQELGIPSSLPTAEKVRRLKDLWNKRLGVDDVTKLPGYNPIPSYDSPAPSTGANSGAFGIPRWKRFDITEDDLDKAMKGYTLTHSLYNQSTIDALEMMLKNNGALVATEEKYRLGVPIRGMSPDQDQRTGGASYVFTRIRSSRTGNRAEYQLHFDKGLLLDTDVISYTGDLYGRVDPSTIKTRRQRNIDDWKNASQQGSNETIIKRNVSLVDHLVRVNVRSEQEKRDVMDLLRRYGITQLGGKPLAEAVYVVR